MTEANIMGEPLGFPTSYAGELGSQTPRSRRALTLLVGPPAAGKSVVRAGLCSVAEESFGWVVAGLYGAGPRGGDSAEILSARCQVLAQQIDAAPAGQLLVVLDEVPVSWLTNKESPLAAALEAALAKEADLMILLQSDKDVETVMRHPVLAGNVRGVRQARLSVMPSAIDCAEGNAHERDCVELLAEMKALKSIYERRGGERDADLDADIAGKISQLLEKWTGRASSSSR